MKRAAALWLLLGLAGCVQAVPTPTAPPSGPLRVTNAGQPFGNDQGMAARKMAESLCAGQGLRLRPGLYDRFEAGTWVYPGGCA